MIGFNAAFPIEDHAPERGLDAPIRILSLGALVAVGVVGATVAVVVVVAVAVVVAVVVAVAVVVTVAVGASSLHPGISINNKTRQIISGMENFRVLFHICIPPLSLE
jgi:hypothetical protein